MMKPQRVINRLISKTSILSRLYHDCAIVWRRAIIYTSITGTQPATTSYTIWRPDDNKPTFCLHILAGGNSVINVHISGVATPRTIPARAQGRGGMGFWMLFALEAAFVAGALTLILALVLPTRAPLARSGDYATIRDAVWARINGTIDDPLIDIAPGVSVRSSNVRGFALNGKTYYYYLEGQRGFDPLSRGAILQRDVEVVWRDADGPAPLVIYQITQ
jgi:hypothetical protein